MIERIPFGCTGHMSSRTLFGAAALGSMRQDKADAILDLLLEFGVNHIDTAAAYGDSELRIAPCNIAMLAQPEYASDFEELYSTCRERGVALQIIKSIARRRWTEADDGPRFSWYRPIRDADALKRAVHFVLSRPGLFLNTSSDATLLRPTLEAAAEAAVAPDERAMLGDSATLGIEPLFARGVSDEV